MSTKPEVFLTRRIPDQGVNLLEKNCDVHMWDSETPPEKEQIMSKVAEVEAEGILCNVADIIDEEVLTASPKLKSVSTFSVGYDHIDLAKAQELNIAVGHTPGVLYETTADLSWALLMDTARRVVEGHEMVREGDWEGWSPTTLLGHNIHGSSLGIIGLGEIGTAMARRAVGFNMDVYYCHEERKTMAEEKLADAGVDITRIPQEQLLEESDFMSLHVPLLEGTQKLIGEPELQAMHEDAILINTSRGEVVDTEALVQALREEWIAAAGLDVTDPEPLPPSHSLFEHEPEKLVLTPHIGSASTPTRNKMARVAVRNLMEGLHGDQPTHSATQDEL